VTDVWYSSQPLGKTKHAEIMQEATSLGGIAGRKTSHSARKTFATTLVDSNVPHNEICQLGGWKNVSTVSHYAKPSLAKQKTASHMLSEVISPSSEEKENHEIESPVSPQAYELSVPATADTGVSSGLSSIQSLSSTNSSNPLSLLAGAAISGEVFNININYK
jgi:hypothetical protein